MKRQCQNRFPKAKPRIGWGFFAWRTWARYHNLAFEPKRSGSRVRIKYRVIPAEDDRSKQMNVKESTFMGKTEARAIEDLRVGWIQTNPMDSISLVSGIF